MRIGINTYFFKFPASGSGQYLLHLLQALAEVDQENEYILLGSQPISENIGAPRTFRACSNACAWISKTQR